MAARPAIVTDPTMPVLKPETDDEGDDDNLPPIAEEKDPVDAVQPKVN